MKTIGHLQVNTLLAFSLPLHCAAVTWLALPKPPLLDGISFSQCVRDRNGKLLRVTLTTDQKYRVWTSLAKYFARADRCHSPI